MGSRSRHKAKLHDSNKPVVAIAPGLCANSVTSDGLFPGTQEALAKARPVCQLGLAMAFVRR